MNISLSSQAPSEHTFLSVHTPSLNDLESQLVFAINCKADFARSCLPSSPSHYGLWLLAGVYGTLSGAAVGATGCVIYKLGEDVYRSYSSVRQAPYTLLLDLIPCAFLTCIPLLPAIRMADMSRQCRERIMEENAAIERELKQLIVDAGQPLARAARDLSPVNFERLLNRLSERLPNNTSAHLPSFIETCHEDHAKAPALADRLLTAKKIKPLLKLAHHSLSHYSTVGESLLNALKMDPLDFIQTLKNHPANAADLLAMLCMAPTAMMENAPFELKEYLQDHAEVAREALHRCKARLSDFGMPDLVLQITQGRLAGIPMAIAQHGSIDMPPA